MSLGRFGKKFRNTWYLFGFCLDKLAYTIQIYLVNFNKTKKRRELNEKSIYLCKTYHL